MTKCDNGYTATMRKLSLWIVEEKSFYQMQKWQI